MQTPGRPLVWFCFVDPGGTTLQNTATIWKKTISLEAWQTSGEHRRHAPGHRSSPTLATTTCAGAYPWMSARQPSGPVAGGVAWCWPRPGLDRRLLRQPEGHRGVGLDINANHLRAATSGWVTGTARPVHIGRTTQVWAIEMVNDAGERPACHASPWRCWRRVGAPLAACASSACRCAMRQRTPPTRRAALAQWLTVKGTPCFGDGARVLMK